MGIATEASTAPSQLSVALASGLEALSKSQEVTFQSYTKVVLSQDGYVFWVATGTTATFVGSLHVITDRHQDEDQTIGANRMIFTSEKEITQFNSLSPTTMWIGTWQLGSETLQVAFSERGSQYEQANLWGYIGYAVYPAMSSQIVASVADLPTGPIVSNSLPIWLSQNSMAQVYPSFLVPDNVAPPYIVAHVEPGATDALGSFPILTWPGTPTPPTALQNMPSSQLMRDRVRLTLYGFTNAQAIQYLQSLIDYSVNTDDFGFMSMPAIRDEKRTQVEIAAIAMKKTIDIVASYYQGTADAAARRLILSASVSSLSIS